MFRAIASFTVFLFTGLSATAHEYWLEARDFTISSEDVMEIGVFVGQNFKGNEYPYDAAQHQSYFIIDGAGSWAPDLRPGDRPSLAVTPREPGLNVIVDVAATQKLTYTEPDQFARFIEHMELDWVLEEHAARNLPETGFGEGYTRYVKALVAVDDGVGQDVHVGMPFELVALANPYTDDISRGLPVRLFFMGNPLPRRKIEVFHKGSEETLTVYTNANGLAIIPVESGTYMLNSVQMVIPPEEDQEATGTSWHSLWASLTFTVD